MASENQDNYFNWPTSTSIDNSTLQRITIDELVSQSQQQQDNQGSPSQQGQEQQLQTITGQIQDGEGNQFQVTQIQEGDNTNNNASGGGIQQAVLPMGIVNPDAILPTNRTYTCRICQVTFPNKSAVTVHSRLHTNHEGKPFRCSFCNKGFSTNFYLKQHERIHNGQKPYKCPMCERSFKQLSHVQQHVRTHTGVRPYKCHWPGCGKAFLQQSHLKSHVARHSPKPSNGLRPFKCHWPDCGKSFAQLNNLKSHIARHQPKTKKKSAEEQLQDRLNLVKQPMEGEESVDDGGFGLLSTQNLIGQAAAAANIMTEGSGDNLEGESIRPFLCPGCSKLYVREATFKKHLEECKTKLQLSISATAAALGIEPPSLPTNNGGASNHFTTTQIEIIGASDLSATSERPAKKRKLSKNARKTTHGQEQQQQLLNQQQQQMMTEIPIEVTLENADGQNLNDIQVKQEVLTITSDGSGILQGNNGTMYKIPQILENHNLINNSILFNSGSSGGLVVTTPLSNASEGMFTVTTSNPNNIHVTSLDSTLSEHQLLTSSPSFVNAITSSNSTITLPISVSNSLTSTQSLIVNDDSPIVEIKAEEKDSIPGHSTINQAALRWQWDQPVRLNFP